MEMLFWVSGKLKGEGHENEVAMATGLSSSDSLT